MCRLVCHSWHAAAAAWAVRLRAARRAPLLLPPSRTSAACTQLTAPRGLLLTLLPPAGADTGMQLHLAGVVPGVPPGDLIVQLEVMPSPVFRREDFDLYVDAPVDMVDAALGTTIE